MINDMIVERIAHIGLEEAMEELQAIAPTLTSQESHKWFNQYERLLSDRTAFRMIGMPKAYSGEKDGSFNELAQARLKLLSLYAYKHP